MSNNKRYFRAVAANWDLGETSKGSEQIAVYFRILDEGAELKGITWYGYFTDLTFERTIESLRIMGWEGNDLANVTDLHKNEVDLVVEDEPSDDGKVYPKVRWVNRAGGLSLKAPLSPEKKKIFAATMRDKIRALDATGGQPQQRKPAPAQRQQGPREPHIGDPLGPPPMSDEDIPF